jgi:hypothetical protein
MGLFNRKDWNIIAVIFERADMFQINGQRVKGAAADKAQEGAKAHPRTILWAVFDQKGTYLSGGPGTGAKNVTPETVKRLDRELRYNRTVLDILKALETGESDRMARPLPWMARAKPPAEE